MGNSGLEDWPPPEKHLVYRESKSILSRGTPPPNRLLVVDRKIVITIPSSNQGQFHVLTLGAGGVVIFSGDVYVGYVIDTLRRIFPVPGASCSQGFAPSSRGTVGEPTRYSISRLVDSR